jgi:hypothetical protein
VAFINITRKYVFLATARTGSTSCYEELTNISKLYNEKFITHRTELPDLYHIGLEEFIYNYPQFRNYYIFATVRDPYTRMISSWSEFSAPGNHIGWADGVKKSKDFYTFLKTFDKNVSRQSVHFRPQYLQLNCLNKRSLDKIMYYENLNDDFLKVTKILYSRPHRLTETCRPTPKVYQSKIIKQKLKEIIYKYYFLDIKKYYHNHSRYSL